MTDFVNETTVHDEEDALCDGYRRSEGGNARRLVCNAQGQIRYVRGWGKWIVYRDGCWILDVQGVLVKQWAARTVQGMFEFAVMRDVTTERGRALLNWALRSETAKGCAAMVDLARLDPDVLIEHTELDQHRELLNVTNGTVDLRTGELLPHDPAHLLTRQVPVAYRPNVEASLWHRCLGEWQPDAEVRDYLQEQLGAGATGYVPEEFVIHLGTGGNGKSKFFEQVQHVLGPYSVVPDESLLVVQKHRQHDTVLASLVGTRLAVASETRRGAPLNEPTVKKLTGGDAIKARRMQENEWEFDPTFSLMLQTNYKPVIRGTDEGIWRRVRLIPWEASFLGNPDPQLGTKLEAEREGVLAWLVEGARRWLERDRKFDVPEAVQRVTAEYRAETDPIHPFIESAFEHDAEGWLPIDTAYQGFLAWRSQSEFVASTPAFRSKRVFAAYVTERYGKSINKKLDGKQYKSWSGIRLSEGWMVEIVKLQASPDDAERGRLDEEIQRREAAQLSVSQALETRGEGA